MIAVIEADLARKAAAFVEAVSAVEAKFGAVIDVGDDGAGFSMEGLTRGLVLYRMPNESGRLALGIDSTATEEVSR